MKFMYMLPVPSRALSTADKLWKFRGHHLRCYPKFCTLFSWLLLRRNRKVYTLDPRINSFGSMCSYMSPLYSMCQAMHHSTKTTQNNIIVPQQSSVESKKEGLSFIGSELRVTSHNTGVAKASMVRNIDAKNLSGVKGLSLAKYHTDCQNSIPEVSPCVTACHPSPLKQLYYPNMYPA